MINNIPEKNNLQGVRYLGNGKIPADQNKTVSSSDKKKEGLKEDTLMLSNEGLAAQEAAKYAGMAHTLPDVDEKRVQLAAAKIKNGSYFTPEIARAVADKILKSFNEGS